MRRHEVFYLALLIASLGSMCVLLTHCAHAKAPAISVVKTLGELGQSARELVEKRCGPGGRGAAAKCHAQHDVVCEEFQRCYKAVKALHSFQVSVLMAKIAIDGLDRGDPKINIAVKAAMLSLNKVRFTLGVWGVKL